MSQQKPEQGHDEQGRFTTVYHDEDIIDILDDAEPTGTGTRDVADTLGCSLVHASRRLNELVEEGRVDARKIGGTRVWRLSDAETEQETSNSSYLGPRNRDHLNGGENE